MCLQKKKKGLGRQASEPGGKDGGWTISHSLVGTQSWKFLVEIGEEKKKNFLQTTRGHQCADNVGSGQGAEGTPGSEEGNSHS